MSNNAATETLTREQNDGRRIETTQDTDSMTGESPTLIGDVLRPKITRRVGCWNVRTLYQTGKLAQVVREMEHYKIELLGVSETRWTGKGSKQLVSGHQILYSGRTDEHHSRGVAIITTKEVYRSLLEWKPVNERIITARFNSAFAKLTVVVCYAPTDDAEDDEKVSFYDSLQEIVDNTPSHDVLLILGDLNAKVGKSNQGRESIMGKQGLGECNSSGERLCTFCQENNLIIGGTIFMHKDIHKTTWNSPDGHTKNQIDHVIINKRWRSSLLDVVAKQGAGVGSDHSLVLAKVKLKLRKSRKKDQRPPPINIQKLKDPKVMKSFQLKVQNKFEALMEHPDEIDIETFNEILLENAQQILGPRKRKKEGWISENTWKIVEQRKEKKKKILSTKSKRQKDQLQAEYRTIDKEVKKNARADRKAYTEKLANEAEQAASKQDMQTLYRITKALAGKFQTADLPVKDKRGNVLSKKEDIQKGWKEHFEEVFNINDTGNEVLITSAINTLDFNTDPPSIEEVKKAIGKLKNGKAAGIDQINAELLKAEEYWTPTILTNILQNIWESEETPTFWRTGLIVKLPKKETFPTATTIEG
ncbi:uncharacterized protein LOC134273760 [Saccostrea cucullata]|uniref:uncharacterized protein LOC134273760 n=1 Tax=Saccostrea cuccullata TaxID=36930 RepID=UPI002ED221D7